MNTPPEPPKTPQLQMLWPESRIKFPPEISIPANYALRTYQVQDKEAYLRLMQEAGFTTFSEKDLSEWLKRVLPNGLFLITHPPTGQLAATAMASHNPDDLHPLGGELGWVAGNPVHAGKGLGKAVCAAAVNRFISAGYTHIYLKTDDWRLPAIKIYLQLGFVPLYYTGNMEERWQTIHKKLK